MLRNIVLEDFKKPLKCYLESPGVERVYVHRAGTVFLYPLVQDTRITWYVNDYDQKNTTGLGAYWGYLVGALDQRNFAMAHHAPLDESSQSTSSTTSTTTSTTNMSEPADKSVIEKGTDISTVEPIKSSDEGQSSIFTYLTSVSSSATNAQPMPTNSSSDSNGSNGQPMPTNSMPNEIPKSIRVSVIVPSMVAPPISPRPVLQPADQNVVMDWADDVIGNYES